MRKLFNFLLPVLAVFIISCEADEIAFLDKEIKQVAADGQAAISALNDKVDGAIASIAEAIGNVVARQESINNSIYESIAMEAQARQDGDLQLAKELANTAITLRQELAETSQVLTNAIVANQAELTAAIAAEAEAREAGNTALANQIAEEVAAREAKNAELLEAIAENGVAIAENVADIQANQAAAQEELIAVADALTEALNTTADELSGAISDNSDSISDNSDSISDNSDSISDNSDAVDAVSGDLGDAINDLESAVENSSAALTAALEYEVSQLQAQITSNQLEIAKLAKTTAENFVIATQAILANAESIDALSDSTKAQIATLAAQTQDIIDNSIATLETAVSNNTAAVSSNTLDLDLVKEELVDVGLGMDYLLDAVNDNANNIDDVTDALNDLSDEVDNLDLLEGTITFNGYVATTGSTVKVAAVAEQGDHVRVFYDGAYRIEFKDVEAGMSGSYQEDLTASTQNHAADIRVDAQVVLDANDDGGVLQIFVEGKAVEGLQEQVADVEEDVNALQEAALAALSRTVSITVAQWGDNNDTTVATYSKSVSGEKEYVTFDIPFDHYFYWHKAANELPNDGSIKAGSPYYLGNAVVRLKFKIGKVDANQDGNDALTQADAVNIETTVNQKAFLDRQVFSVWVDGDKSNVSAHPTKELKLVINVSNTNARQVTIEQDADGDGVYENRKKWIGGGNHLAKRQDITNWLKNKARVREDWTDAEAAYYYETGGYTTENNKQVTTFKRANTSLKNTVINSTPLRKSFIYKTIRLEYSSSDFYTIEDNGGWKKVQRAYNAGVHDFDKKFYLPQDVVVLEDFEKEVDITFNGYYEGQGQTTVTGVAEGTAGDGFITLSLKGMGTTNVTGRWDGILTNLTFSARKNATESYIGDKCDYDANDIDPDLHYTKNTGTKTVNNYTFKYVIYDIAYPYGGQSVSVGGNAPQHDYDIQFSGTGGTFTPDSPAFSNGYLTYAAIHITSHALSGAGWNNVKNAIKNSLAIDVMNAGQNGSNSNYLDDSFNVTLTVTDTECTGKSDSITKDLKNTYGGTLQGRRVL